MIVIRKATEADVHIIYELRRRAILDKCAAHYTKEQLSLWTHGGVSDGFVQDVISKFYKDSHPKIMNIPKLLISEIPIAFLIGALPLWIVVNTNPNTQVVESLSSLNPGDPVVMYLFYLLLLHLGIWAANRFILKTNETASDFFGAAHRFSHQVGFTIHSIYRAIAGAIPAAIGLLAYRHGLDSGAFKVSILSSILVLGSLFMCCLLTWLSEITAPRKKWL